MSRSNHHYFNICCRPPGTNGFCEWHEPAGYWHPQRTCISQRDVVTRRGIYHRRPRFPEWSVKSWHSGVPTQTKKRWQRRARARQKQEFLRNCEDPLLTPMKWLIDFWDVY